ncbi:MAG: hypothetical protein ACREJC_21430, partial [Tepidisphaeraceae bacterium]
MFGKFKSLDGRHPWRGAGPHGYVNYRARYRPGGRVVYFNYALARELELIPVNHAQRMTAALERSILQAFSLQIINEYDEEHGASFPPGSVKPRPYMATRYLQIQHKDRRGKTSGDGRAIWNGMIRTARLTFDVSSRGTGATRLSPGAQIAGQPVKTGDDRWGYSCGQADLDEMLGTAVMSEVFFRNGLPTERTLAVIDFGDGTAIGVRTAPNLIRPAHIFRYVKLGMHDALRASIDYFIARQQSNGFWKLPANPALRYSKALSYLAESYGKLSAVLEEEYIFNWLSWDGDNMLASGAILDYGSVRQFASKHDKYRYDDVDRFSTCLTEQRRWARELVKVFAQAMHFAHTGTKLNLRRFNDAACLRTFDRAFSLERDRRMLWRLGFEPRQIDRLLKRASREIRDLRRAMAFFEDQKVLKGPEKLSDGITHNPVFLIRNLLRQLPGYYLDERGAEFGQLMPPDEFCKIMAASYVSRRDLRMTSTRDARARNFQMCYQRLIRAAGNFKQVLTTVRDRSAVNNHEHRMTGNAIILLVDEMIKRRDKMDRNDLQTVIDRFIDSQVLIPGQWRPLEAEELTGTTAKSKLL